MHQTIIKITKRYKNDNQRQGQSQKPITNMGQIRACLACYAVCICKWCSTPKVVIIRDHRSSL